MTKYLYLKLLPQFTHTASSLMISTVTVCVFISYSKIVCVNAMWNVFINSFAGGISLKLVKNVILWWKCLWSRGCIFYTALPDSLISKQSPAGEDSKHNNGSLHILTRGIRCKSKKQLMHGQVKIGTLMF